VPPAGVFFTTPYLQLGDNATDASRLSVVWHTATVNASEANRWRVETRSPAGIGEWVRKNRRFKRIRSLSMLFNRTWFVPHHLLD
jgi:hypothetical protein